MAEEKPRTLKVLEELSKRTEPTSPADIGIIIKLSPRDTGKTLYDLGKGGLARKPDEKQSLWLITDKGRKYIGNPPVPSVRPLSPTLEPTLQPTTQTDHSEPPLLEPPGEEQRETVPSQADLEKEGLLRRNKVAEEKSRVQKVLEQLYQTEGALRPKEIAEKIGETPLNAGKDLHALKERGLAESESEGQWKITTEGREWLEGGGGKEMGKESERKGNIGAVPSQADLEKEGLLRRSGLGKNNF